MDNLYKESQEAYAKLKQYTYYIIIATLSLLALVFLPMLGSDISGDFKFPTSSAGWFVYISTKLCVATISFIIFDSFIKQAKINVANDPNYKEATEILNLCKKKNYVPRSPKTVHRAEYGRKGVTIFLSSILATWAFSEALLRFDLVTLLSYLFTIVMSIIFGVMEMLKYETYWTTEFLDYAKYEKEINQNGNND